MTQSSNPIAQLSELIDGIAFAILTTTRPDSSLHSCPMASHGLDANGSLWFLTSSNTEKVEAVRTMQRVNLAFVDHPRQRYVSISGFCELVRDRARTKELWDPSYGAWFPAGVADPNLILLKIHAQQAEYWDATQGRMIDVPGLNKVPIE